MCSKQIGGNRNVCQKCSHGVWLGLEMCNRTGAQLEGRIIRKALPVRPHPLRVSNPDTDVNIWSAKQIKIQTVALHYTPNLYITKRSRI